MSNSNMRYFQWLVGDRKGEIVFFDKIESEDGNIYIVFKDKSRINEQFVAQINHTDISGKLMAEIDNPNNSWKFVERKTPDNNPIYEVDANTGVKYEIPSADDMVHADLTGETGTVLPQKPKNKIIDLVPPKRTPPSHSVFGLISNPPVSHPESQRSLIESPQQSYHEVMNIEEKIKDPVYILMSKTKKVDMELNMGMTVSLPPKSLYELAKESFDNGDIKFIDYIVDEITVNEIKNALKTAIKEMYEFNVETNDNVHL